MSDQKITQLNAATSVVGTDLSVVVTNPGTVPETKNITIANLTTSLGVPIAATTVADATTYGVASNAGTATTFSKGDHTHGSVQHDAHNNLTGITANQHHNQSHTQADHTGTGAVAELTDTAAAIGTGTLPARVDHTHQKAVNANKAGSLVVSTPTINFIDGANILVTVTNNAGVADVTVASQNLYAATAVNLSLDATYRIVKVTAPSTITLPTAASIAGRDYVINAVVDGVIVNTTSSQTINGSLSWVLPANSSMSVYSDGANWQIF